MKTRVVISMLSLLMVHVYCSCQPAMVKMDLKTDGKDHHQIQRGMPVILNVVIYSIDRTTPEMLLDMLPDSLKEEPSFLMKLDSAINNSIFPEYGKLWVDRILFDYQAPGQPKSFKIKPFVLQPFPEDQISLSTPCFIDYGIDPDETKKWKAGTILIRAGLQVTETNDTIWSDSMSLRVLDPALNRLRDYSNAQLIYIGNYWLRRGMCDEADQFAEELMRRDSIAYQHILLKAEIYQCKNDLEQALEMFNKAFDAFYEQEDPDSHPPEYLQEMIINLQNRLQMLKPK